MKTVLNMRREIQFLRVQRVYNGPDVRTGYRPVIACFSVRNPPYSYSLNHYKMKQNIMK